MVDGFEYVNQHIVLYTKLDELLMSKIPEMSKMQKFVDNIIDKDFETVHQLLENTSWYGGDLAAWTKQTC
eukprot:2509832-Ditylum_brightwellii.AAC.1